MAFIRQTTLKKVLFCQSLPSHVLLYSSTIYCTFFTNMYCIYYILYVYIASTMQTNKNHLKKKKFFFLSHSQFSSQSFSSTVHFILQSYSSSSFLLSYFSIISIYFIIFFFSSISIESYETDFEFILDYNFLIWLNINSIYFMVSYSDFIIFNFYEYHFL